MYILARCTSFGIFIHKIFNTIFETFKVCIGIMKLCRSTKIGPEMLLAHEKITYHGSWINFTIENSEKNNLIGYLLTWKSQT